MNDATTINRNARALFHFMSVKHRNDRRVGDLTLGDFIEICEFLAKFEDKNEELDDEQGRFG
jgi:hypothetical protein